MWQIVPDLGLGWVDFGVSDAPDLGRSQKRGDPLTQNAFAHFD